MDLLAYLGKGLTTSFLGFFPIFEVYVAVPAGILMGLDYVSAVGWGVTGNFLVVPLMIFFSTQLMRIARLRLWLERRSTERRQRAVDRYGAAFVVLMTPLLGVWLMSALAAAAGMRRTTLLWVAFCSITAYGILSAAGVALGFEWFT
jgi:uncharacterized membrane protein